MSQTGSSEGGGGVPPIPETIDHYTVVRRIGRGGQGEVYLGHDPNLDIDVAIKVLHSDFRTDEFIDRFKVEARTSVRLTAPNIVRVYNFNPKYPYLVMEYCGDGDLERCIKSRRPMSLARSLSIVKQICAALETAHGHDPPILHRDLKPGNVLFNKNVAKVADFGLAKMLGATSGLTTTRGMMGTVGYASPEQLMDASKAGPQSDLWAVGVILYELLTFKRPFEKPGDDYVNVAIKVRMEPPAPPPYSVPAPLWNVIERALQRDTAERFSTARELTRALDEAARAVGNASELMLPPAEVLEEVDRLAASAAGYLEESSLEEAERVVSTMREGFGDDPLTRFWSKRLREIQDIEGVSGSKTSLDSDDVREARWLESRLNSVRSLIAKREYREARKTIYELLMKDPDNTVVQKYIERIDEQEAELTQAFNEAHAEADRARGAGDLKRVLEIWKGLDERFPDFPDIQAELAVATRGLRGRQMRDRRIATERAANKLLEDGDGAGAIAAWDAHLASHPDDDEAARAREALLTEQRDRIRAERLRRLSEESERLREAGDLESALELWRRLLEELPGDEEATVRAEALRRDIVERDRAQRVEGARVEAEKCLAVDDVQGAVGAWRACLDELPDCEEAVRQLAALEQKLRAARIAAIREELERPASVLEARLRGGRYQGLPEARGRIAAALESARLTDGEGIEKLEAARAALVAAGDEAEAALGRSIQSVRARLQPRLAEALELLSEVGAEEAPDLAATVTEAVDVLSADCWTQPIEDPLAPLEAIDQELATACEQVSRRQQEALDRARSRASQALAGARQAVEALTGAGGPAADSLMAELDRLREGAESSSLGKLATVARDAAVLRARGQAALLESASGLFTRLGELHESATELLPGFPEGRLRELTHRAARTLEQEEDIAAAAAEAPPLISELEAEVSGCRERLEADLEAARERWDRAEGGWARLASEKPGAEIVEQAESIRTEGHTALEASLCDEVKRHAERLETLTRAARVESLWTRRRDAVVALETASDDDDGHGGAKEQIELLGRLRSAFASGDPEELASLDRAIGKATSRRGGRTARTAAVPRLGKAARRLNERYHARALGEFDRLSEEYEKARRSKDPDESNRLISKLDRTYERLLRPAPVTRRPLPLLAAAAIVAVALVGGASLMGGTETSVVAVVSAVGETRVVELLRNDREVDPPPEVLTVSESGARWELEAGSYALTTDAGQQIRFEVPGTTTLVLPGTRTDFASELIKVLQLEEAIAAGGM